MCRGEKFKEKCVNHILSKSCVERGLVGGKGCSDSQFTTGGLRLVLAVCLKPGGVGCSYSAPCKTSVNHVLAGGQVKTSLVAGLSSGARAARRCPAAVVDGRLSVQEVRAAAAGWTTRSADPLMGCSA